MTNLLLPILLLLLRLAGRPATGAQHCFRAAVLQHRRIPASDCLESARLNLEAYSRAAAEASQRGAKLIVFPEDGLFHGSRSQILPCLSEIPQPPPPADAGKLPNPCLDQAADPSRPAWSLIMSRLSCIARSNGILLVANLGTRQSCRQATTNETASSPLPPCPHKRDLLILNTDVVFDAQGGFIQRYRKFNRFVEVYDAAPALELALFETPFAGRLGLFTCFDILFQRPAVELVEKYHVDTVLFPTWWFDKLPIHSAIQFQEAWSWGRGVNLLAANLVAPEKGSVGSGIFSRDGNGSSVYTGASSPEPKLILANLPVGGSPPGACQAFEPEVLEFDSAGAGHGLDPADQQPARDPPAAYKPNTHYEIGPADVVFRLRGRSDDATVCLAEVCCHLRYKLAAGTPDELLQRLVLLVRDGRQPTFGWWEQVCLLATTQTPFEPSQLGAVRYSLEAEAHFERLAMSSNMTTKYVYPFANRNVSQLIERRARRFQCQDPGGGFACEHELAGAGLVNSFGLYARSYNKD